MTVPRAKAAAVWAYVERTRTIDKTIGRRREAIREAADARGVAA